MANPVFEGVGVPVVTLFNDDASLDAAATAELAAQLVDLGMRAVVVAGSTGEAASLDRDERVQLLHAVRKTVTSVPVIAGTGQPSTRQAVVVTKGQVNATPFGGANLKGALRVRWKPQRSQNRGENSCRYRAVDDSCIEPSASIGTPLQK